MTVTPAPFPPSRPVAPGTDGDETHVRLPHSFHALASEPCLQPYQEPQGIDFTPNPSSLPLVTFFLYPASVTWSVSSIKVLARKLSLPFSILGCRCGYTTWKNVSPGGSQPATSLLDGPTHTQWANGHHYEVAAPNLAQPFHTTQHHHWSSRVTLLSQARRAGFSDFLHASALSK